MLKVFKTLWRFAVLTSLFFVVFFGNIFQKHTSKTDLSSATLKNPFAPDVAHADVPGGPTPDPFSECGSCPDPAGGPDCC